MQIKLVKTHGPPTLMLCDENGTPFPGQLSTLLKAETSNFQTFTVTFRVGAIPLNIEG